MFKQLTLFYLFTLYDLAFSASSGSLTNNPQYIIVYITSDSSISPLVFETSFNVFKTSLQSVIIETLPTLSTSFNITEINLWCLPDSSDYHHDIYSSFYIKIDYSTETLNANDILSPIIERMNNDLLPQVLLDKIETIDSLSPLCHPKPFIFETYHITAAVNASFILGDMDCISYLIDTQKQHSQTSNIETVINHDTDDFAQFIFYGATVHWKVFVIWSVICVVTGMFLCTSVVCCHIYLTEKRRKRRKKKFQKQKRLQRNDYFSEQTPSCVTPHMHLSPISYEDEGEDMIAIIRPRSTTTHVTAIAHNNARNVEINRRNKCIPLQKVKSNSLTIDSQQSQLIRQQYNERQRRKTRKRTKSSTSLMKIRRGYDKINNFDDEDDMKEEELIAFDDDANMNRMTKQMSLDGIELIEEEDAIRRSSTEKIVTVHVHHHYNPNATQSPVQYTEQKEECYPDLPYEPQFNFNHKHDDGNISHYIAINSPISQAQSSPKYHHGINNIITMSHNKMDLKEPSKSQREGFSPYAFTRPRSDSEAKGVRVRRSRSIASQPDDNVSDSELMYVPAPAADDTPGQTQTPHIDIQFNTTP